MNTFVQIFGNNQRPMFIHEVTDRSGTESVKCSEFTGIGRYTDFSYGMIVSYAAKRQNKGFGYVFPKTNCGILI